MEFASAILGVPAFAAALLDTAAQSYTLVERYKAAEPRKRQLLNEIKTTLELLTWLRGQLSDPGVAERIESSLAESLYAWCSRCQTTHYDIELYFGPTVSGELRRRFKVKLASNEDLFASFERRVSGDRDQLVTLLEILNFDLIVRNSQGQDRIESHTAFASAALLALEDQSQLRECASQLSFGTITAQLSQLIRHVGSIDERLHVLKGGPEVPQGRSGLRAPTAEVVQQVVRVVQHATQQYISHGKLKRDLVVLDCPATRNLRSRSRRAYAWQLTFLRLASWLLQHAVVSHELLRALSYGEESLIGRHARLSFAWQISTSLGNLDTALRGPVASALPSLPDLRYKPWVQYLLDRVGQGLLPADEASSSKELLSLIDKFWDHFPAPSQGLNIYFVVPIDRSFKRAKCQCELCNFMMNRDADIDSHERLNSAMIGSGLLLGGVSSPAMVESLQQVFEISPQEALQVLEFLDASTREQIADALPDHAGSLRKCPKLAAPAFTAADDHEAPQRYTAPSLVTPQESQLADRQNADTCNEAASAKLPFPQVVEFTCASRGFCDVGDLTEADHCLQRREWRGIKCRKARAANYHCCYIRSDEVERIILRIFIRRHGGAFARWSWLTINGIKYYCVFSENPMSDLVFAELKATSKISRRPPTTRPTREGKPKRP